MPPNTCASSARTRASLTPVCARPSSRLELRSTKSTRPPSRALPGVYATSKEKLGGKYWGCWRPRSGKARLADTVRRKLPINFRRPVPGLCIPRQSTRLLRWRQEGYLAAPSAKDQKDVEAPVVRRGRRLRPRASALMDGAVQVDGVDGVMNLPPEEIFFRAFRSMDFDICELSMSSFSGENRRRQLSLCGRAGLRLTRIPPQLD